MHPISDHDPHASDLSIGMRAAIDSARALEKIASHENECARRYTEMQISISRFHSRMDQLVTVQEEQRDEEMKRRDQRDRDTRQTRAMALIAAMSSIIAGLVALGLHFWK